MQSREPIPYVGRFAPSPTGPLHFGSLVAAAASYLQARANNGLWLLRVEDIDPPREQAGASAAIIEGLERYGFEWDDECLFQSTRSDAHEAALAALLDKEVAYRCDCSRRDLADVQRGPLGLIYPGTCRDGCSSGDAAIRLRTNQSDVAFVDLLQGRFTQNLEKESGDFVIRRRDGLIAYHLAVVVDDAFQGITEIVRGIDLLDSTPRQIWLQKLLGYSIPNYAHFPVITHVNGDKLSKLTGEPGIPMDVVAETLIEVIDTLGLKAPPKLATESLPEIWSWAKENWQIKNLCGQKTIIKTS
jgi:glutamyl-Q tRNA(Asp) synthetase